jgi:hypothetical protein
MIAASCTSADQPNSSFAAAMLMTIDNKILAKPTGNRKLPSVAPMPPPITTATASQTHPRGIGEPELTTPASPAIELTPMKTADTAEAVLVLAQPKNNSSGVK